MLFESSKINDWNQERDPSNAALTENFTVGANMFERDAHFAFTFSFGEYDEACFRRCGLAQVHVTYRPGGKAIHIADHDVRTPQHAGRRRPDLGADSCNVGWGRCNQAHAHQSMDVEIHRIAGVSFYFAGLYERRCHSGLRFPCQHQARTEPVRHLRALVIPDLGSAKGTKKPFHGGNLGTFEIKNGVSNANEHRHLLQPASTWA